MFAFLQLWSTYMGLRAPTGVGNSPLVTILLQGLQNQFLDNLDLLVARQL